MEQVSDEEVAEIGRLGKFTCRVNRPFPLVAVQLLELACLECEGGHFGGWFLIYTDPPHFGEWLRVTESHDCCR